MAEHNHFNGFISASERFSKGL